MPRPDQLRPNSSISNPAIANCPITANCSIPRIASNVPNSSISNSRKLPQTIAGRHLVRKFAIDPALADLTAALWLGERLSENTS
jgi:hypothetical protein